MKTPANGIVVAVVVEAALSGKGPGKLRVIRIAGNSTPAGITRPAWTVEVATAQDAMGADVWLKPSAGPQRLAALATLVHLLGERLASDPPHPADDQAAGLEIAFKEATLKEAEAKVAHLERQEEESKLQHADLLRRNNKLSEKIRELTNQLRNAESVQTMVAQHIAEAIDQAKTVCLAPDGSDDQKAAVRRLAELVHTIDADRARRARLHVEMDVEVVERQMLEAADRLAELVGSERGPGVAFETVRFARDGHPGYHLFLTAPQADEATTLEWLAKALEPRIQNARCFACNKKSNRPLVVFAMPQHATPGTQTTPGTFTASSVERVCMACIEKWAVEGSESARSVLRAQAANAAADAAAAADEDL